MCILAIFENKFSYQQLINTMNFYKLIFLIPFTVICIVSCSGTKKKSRQPVSQILLSTKHRKISCGDSLTIKINTRLKNGVLKKSELYLDDRLLTDQKEISYSISISTSDLTMGTHTLKSVVTKEDGMIGTNFKTIEIISEVIPESLTYKVINTYPHEHDFFTQGLEIHNNTFYEGTGEYGKSGLFKLKFPSFKIERQIAIDEDYFGEGITIVNNKIYQLTWKAQKAFVYNLSDFSLIQTFSYSNKEGWGLANDTKQLYMSDGTSNIFVRDPETFKVIRTFGVADNNGPISQLNELEFIDGYFMGKYMDNRQYHQNRSSNRKGISSCQS